MNESKQTVSNSSLQKAAEFSGAAGELCCHSLHRSQDIIRFSRALERRRTIRRIACRRLGGTWYALRSTFALDRVGSFALVSVHAAPDADWRRRESLVAEARSEAAQASSLRVALCTVVLAGVVIAMLSSAAGTSATNSPAVVCH